MSPSETSPLAAWTQTNRTLPTLETIRSTFAGPVQAIAFWAAIGLPLLYVPMLATGAIWEDPVALFVLFVLNIVAFVVGHEHNQPDSSQKTD